ncbi:MAG: DUF4860 domain-containing protein [Oscillospiraceae bacterium]
MTRSSLALLSVTLVLLLYLLFIASAAATLLLGVKAQSNLCSISGHSFEDRTVPAFIAEKLHESDGVGAVYTGNFGGASALYIECSLEGLIYTDIIYGYDDQLYELFCEKGAVFSCEDGTQLVSLGQIAFFETKTGLIQAIITGSDGKTRVLYFFLRSGGET